MSDTETSKTFERIVSRWLLRQRTQVTHLCDSLEALKMKCANTYGEAFIGNLIYA